MNTVPAHGARDLARTRLRARILGAVSAALVLFIVIGEALAANRRGGPSPTPTAAIGIGATVLYGVGLLMALVWEFPGALLSAIAVATIDVAILLGAFPDAPGGRAMLLNPFMLALWIPVGAYSWSWRAHRRSAAAASSAVGGEQASG